MQRALLTNINANREAFAAMLSDLAQRGVGIHAPLQIGAQISKALIMLVAVGLPPDMEEFSLQPLHSVERMLTSHPDARAAIPQRGDILAWFQTGSSPKFAIGCRILIISRQEC